MEREETSMFPGDSAALKGKAVKIFTVQPVSQNPKESGGAVRLNHSLALFQKGLKEAAGANPTAGGNRGDFRFSGRRDRGSDVGRDPEKCEGRGFAESVLDAELSGFGGGVLGDWASVTLAV